MGRERVVSMDKLVALYMQAREVVGTCWGVVFHKNDIWRSLKV